MKELGFGDRVAQFTQRGGPSSRGGGGDGFPQAGRDSEARFRPTVAPSKRESEFSSPEVLEPSRTRLGVADGVLDVLAKPTVAGC